VADKYFKFDPTVHAGHLITATAVIFAAGGVYMSVQNDIAQLKKENSGYDKRISSVENRNIEQDEKWEMKYEQLAKDQSQIIGKLRDDMNAWFVRLEYKLDNKQDKK